MKKVLYILRSPPVFRIQSCLEKPNKSCDCSRPFILCLFLSPGIPIKFTSHLKNVRVKEKGKAHLECEMSSKDVHIRWQKDGRDITRNSRYIFMREGKRAEVIIEDCEAADEGEYAVVCTQDNDANDYTSSASLTVEGNVCLTLFSMGTDQTLYLVSMIA